MGDFNTQSSNLFFVHAMARSGQHPIIDWIYSQFDNDKVFFNYCNYTRSDFFGKRTQYYFNDKKYYFRLNPNWVKFGVLENKLKEFDPEEKEQLIRLKECRKNLLSMNFENLNLEHHTEKFNKFQQQFKRPENLKNILVVRDIYNYLASKMKMGRYFFPETNLECWKAHAREFLGLTNNMENKVCVNYNEWTTNTKYRKKLAKKLDVNIFNENWDHVSSFGGGSSFEGQRLQGKGSEMKTLERWRSFVDNKEYRDYLKDTELIDLSNKIFGKIHGTEVFEKKS